MIVAVAQTINASRADVWAAITDIENAAEIIQGIERIEIVNTPAKGLVGLRWRETRMLFGDAATVEKWITDAVDREFYKTRAESNGFVFVTTNRISGENGRVTLTSAHDSQPQTIVARLQSIPMGLFFRGVARKALLQDLVDIKAAAEQQHGRASR